MKIVRKIKNINMKNTYKLILPSISFFGLCFVASINGHKLIANNSLVDFLFRIIISAYFYFLYNGLVKEKNMNIKYFYNDNKDITGEYSVLFGGLINSFGNGLITFWIMNKFFLYNEIVNITVSIINAIIIIVPIVLSLENKEIEK